MLLLLYSILGAFLRFLSHWGLADWVLILCPYCNPSELCRIYFRWEFAKFCIFRASYITGLSLMRTKWDHAIELKEDSTPFTSKIYPLSKDEQQELDGFIKEHLRSGRIHPSKSPIASPFFFIKKKDGRLCPVQDYHHLNAMTISFTAHLRSHWQIKWCQIFHQIWCMLGVWECLH